MLNRVCLWVRDKVKILIELALSLVSACIAFIVAFYGILTINLNLATRGFFNVGDLPPMAVPLTELE
jgi:hypothetical protein